MFNSNCRPIVCQLTEVSQSNAVHWQTSTHDCFSHIPLKTIVPSLSRPYNNLNATASVFPPLRDAPSWTFYAAWAVGWRWRGLRHVCAAQPCSRTAGGGLTAWGGSAGQCARRCRAQCTWRPGTVSCRAVPARASWRKARAAISHRLAVQCKSAKGGRRGYPRLTLQNFVLIALSKGVVGQWRPMLYRRKHI